MTSDHQQLCVSLHWKAEELKKAASTVKKVTVFKDSNLWAKHHELTSTLKRLILLDLDYALDKKADVDLWNLGFKDLINQVQSEANSRSVIVDKKKKSEATVLLKWFLDLASGFYILLLQEICVTYDLDLPFMRSASFYGVSIEASVEVKKCINVASINYICAHCLVHLGDLARYRGQISEADLFYRHSLKVAPSSGHAYNQIALLEVGKGRTLASVYYYVRSVALKCPFPAASSNLARMYSKILTTLDWTSEDFLSKFLVFHALLHSATNLKKALALCQDLSDSLTSLVASESLKTKDLLQCIAITLFQTNLAFEGQNKDSTWEEKLIRRLNVELLTGMLNAFLLPVYTVKQGQALLDFMALPLVKVILDWIILNPKATEEPGFIKRQQIWPGLARMLNELNGLDGPINEDFPLPEEFDLQAFTPVCDRLKDRNFRQVLKGASLSLDDIKALRASRILEQGRILASPHWPGRKVLEVKEDGRFDSLDLKVSTKTLEDLEKELEKVQSDDDEEPQQPEMVEDEQPPISAVKKKSQRQNVAMAAILRQAAQNEGQGRQVTFKSPSPAVSEDSSTISQDESRSGVDFPRPPPPYMMRAAQRPPPNFQRPPQMNFSVPPPPLMNRPPPPSQRFDLRGQNPWTRPQQQLKETISAAALSATFTGPSYSLFSGNSPSWSLNAPPSPQRPTTRPQQQPSASAANFLFQPGPSPLERLLQLNMNNPHHQPRPPM
jgi:hypothetical protein